MVWKIYHIQSGELVKAGFSTEDDAQDWLERHSSSSDNAFEIEEMDEDEWIEYQELVEKHQQDGSDESAAIGRHPDDFIEEQDQGHDGDDVPEEEPDHLTMVDEEEE